MGKWYKQGFDDAVNGLGCDAPYQRGNKHFDSYNEGYEDGQRQIDAEADFDRAGWRYQHGQGTYA